MRSRLPLALAAVGALQPTNRRETLWEYSTATAQGLSQPGGGGGGVESADTRQEPALV